MKSNDCNYGSRGVIVFKPISPFYTKYQRVSSVVDGVLSHSSQFVEYSCKEKIYSSEFSLGNLIAVGAVNNLSYVSMSVNSDMNFVDAFANSYNTTLKDVSKNV